MSKHAPFWSWPHGLYTTTHSKAFADLALLKGSIFCEDTRETHSKSAASNTSCSSLAHLLLRSPACLTSEQNTSLMQMFLSCWLCCPNYTWFPSPRALTAATETSFGSEASHYKEDRSAISLTSKRIHLLAHSAAGTAGPTRPCAHVSDMLKVTQPAQDGGRMRIPSSCLILRHLNYSLLMSRLQFIRPPPGLSNCRSGELFLADNKLKTFPLRYSYHHFHNRNYYQISSANNAFWGCSLHAWRRQV